MAHPNKLLNARVLVFGGTSGIGFAVASLCLSSGSQVIISGSQQHKVDTKVAALQSLYPSLPPSNVTGHACDLLDTENLEANLTTLFEKATNGGADKIDHVVFTAGDIREIPHVSKVTTDSALYLGRVRFLGPVFIAKLLSSGKYMALSPSSSLTLTGGTNSKKPFPGWAVVAAWGSNTEGLVRGLAVDLKPLRVNMVEPGAIHTELLQGYLDRAGEGVLKTMEDQSLLAKVGQPFDVAEAYAWLMRDSFVTGTVAASDGGRLLA